jgi:hypothetical protein
MEWDAKEKAPWDQDWKEPAAKADAAPWEKDWTEKPETTFLGNVAEAGKGVAPGVVQFAGTAVTGLGGNTIGNANKILSTFDAIDAGEYERPEAVLGMRKMNPMVGAYYDNPERRGEFRARVEQTLESGRQAVRGGQATEKFGRELWPASPGYEESTGRVFGEGAGTLIAGVGLSALPVVGPGLAAATFAMSGSGEAVDNYIQDRQKKGLPVDEETLVTAARAGVIPGVTDSLPVETLLGRIPVPGVGLLKLPAWMVGKAMQVVGKIGWQATVEGIQEGGQQWLQNLISKQTYNPEQDLGEGILNNAESGAEIGGAAEAVKLAAQRFSGRRRARTNQAGDPAPADNPDTPPVPAAELPDMPAIGATVGVSQGDMPPKRAEVEWQSADGRFVRVKYDDGSREDMRADQLASSLTEPPPPIEGADAAPPNAETGLDYSDVLALEEELAEADAAKALEARRPKPRPDALPGIDEAGSQLDLAARLRQAAANPKSGLNDQARIDAVLEAARLDREYAAKKAAPVTPESEAATAAARRRREIGPLANVEDGAYPEAVQAEKRIPGPLGQQEGGAYPEAVDPAAPGVPGPLGTRVDGGMPVFTDADRKKRVEPPPLLRNLPGKKGDVQALARATQARMAARAADAKAIGAAGQPVKMVGKDGKRALVGPDVAKPGAYRLTRFDEAGPIGHSEYGSLEAAALDALREGYAPEGRQAAPGGPMAGGAMDGVARGDSPAVERPVPTKPQKQGKVPPATNLSRRDAASVIAKAGGIRDDEGRDIKGFMGRKFVPGMGPLLRPKGRSLSEIGEALQDAGFIPRGSVGGGQPSESQVLKILERIGRGEKVYTPEDEAIAAEDAEANLAYEKDQARRDDIRGYANDQGVSMSEDDVESILTDLARDADLTPDVAVDLYVERTGRQVLADLAEETNDAGYQRALDEAALEDSGRDGPQEDGLAEDDARPGAREPGYAGDAGNAVEGEKAAGRDEEDRGAAKEEDALRPADRIEREARSIAEGIAASKARAMRYQPDAKDLVAEYLTAQGTPTKSEDLDLPFEEWQAVYEKFGDAAARWKRGDSKLQAIDKVVAPDGKTLEDQVVLPGAEQKADAAAKRKAEETKKILEARALTTKMRSSKGQKEADEGLFGDGSGKKKGEQGSLFQAADDPDGNVVSLASVRAAREAAAEEAQMLAEEAEDDAEIAAWQRSPWAMRSRSAADRNWMKEFPEFRDNRIMEHLNWRAALSEEGDDNAMRRSLAASDVWAESDAAQAFIAMEDRLKDRMISEMASLENQLFEGPLSDEVYAYARKNARIRKQIDAARNQYDTLRERAGLNPVDQDFWWAGRKDANVPLAEDIVYMAAMQQATAKTQPFDRTLSDPYEGVPDNHPIDKALTPAESKFFESFFENDANRAELLEEVPSLEFYGNSLRYTVADENNLFQFIEATIALDGRAAVPPRLRSGAFFRPDASFQAADAARPITSVSHDVFGVSDPSPAFQEKRDAVHAEIKKVLRRIAGPGVNPKVFDQLFNVYENQQGDTDIVEIKGSFVPIDRIISVAMASDNPMRTARHEAIHFLKQSGLIPKPMWDALAKKAESSWIKKYHVETRWPRLSHAGHIEEAIAEGVAHVGDEAANSMVTRGLLRIADIFARIRNIMSRNGLPTWHQAFRAIEDGKLGSEINGAPSYALGETDTGASTLIDKRSGQTLGEFENRRDAEDQALYWQNRDDTAAEIEAGVDETMTKVADENVDRMGASKFQALAVRSQAAPTRQKHALRDGASLAIFPRGLASIDTASSRYWNTWKSLEDDIRVLTAKYSKMSQKYAALSPESRKKVNAVEELDRHEGTVRQNTGRQVVSRNTGKDNLRFSKPGDTTLLTPSETAAYFERRNLFQNVWKDYTEATARRLGWDGPMSIPAMQAEVARAQAAGQKARANQVGRVIAAVQELNQQQRKGYVPFMRRGDHYVAVRKKVNPAGGQPDTEWFELVETRQGVDAITEKRTTPKNYTPRALQARVDELRAKFPANQYDILTGPITPKEVETINLPALEKLVDAASSANPSLFGPLHNQVLQNVYDDMKASWKKKSRSIPGYSDNFDLATADYLRGSAGNIASMTWANQLDDAYHGTQTHENKNVRKYWENFSEYMNDPATDFARLRQFGFFYYLWGVPSSALVNLSQTPLITTFNIGSWAGQGTGQTATYRAMAQAFKALRADGMTGIHLDVSKLGNTPAERQMLARLEKNGTLGAQMTQEMWGLNRTETTKIGQKTAPLRQKLWDIGASMFGGAEQVNRATAALAAFRAAQNPANIARAKKVYAKNTLFQEMADAYGGVTPEMMAQFTVDESQFVSGKINRPQVARGIGSAILQFKLMAANYIRLINQQMRRMGPEGKIAGTLMLAALVLSAGLKGLPFAEEVIDLSEWAYKFVTETEPDFERNIRSFMVEHGMSPLAAEIAMTGPSRAITKTDIGPRVGQGDLIPRLTLGDTLGIPFAATAGRAYEAAQRFGTDQDAAGLAALAPAALKNILTSSTVLPTEGLKTQSGDRVVAPADVTMGNLIAKGLGFNPADFARATEERTSQNRVKHAADLKRARLYTKLAAHLTQADEAEAAGNQKRADAENQRYDDLITANSAELEDADMPDYLKTPANNRTINSRRRAFENWRTAQIKGASKMAREELQRSPFVQTGKSE